MTHRMGEVLRSCELGALVGARGGVEHVEGKAPSGKGAAAATLEAGYHWSPGPLRPVTPSQVPSQAAHLIIVLANAALTLSTAKGSSDRNNSSLAEDPGGGVCEAWGNHCPLSLFLSCTRDGAPTCFS